MGTRWKSAGPVGSSAKDCCSSSCFPRCLLLGNVPLKLMGSNSLLLFHSVQRGRLVPELTCHKLNIYDGKPRAACHLQFALEQSGWSAARDKMVGDARKMSGCCVIHYSEACGHMFYLKWHVIEVLNLLENMLFKTCKTWRRGTCLSYTVIAWKSPFYEAGTTYKIWSILCLHINGNNSKYSRSWGGPVCPEGRNGFWAGQGQQWKGHEFYMLHIINSHIWNGNSADVSVNVQLEQSVHPVFITGLQVQYLTSNHILISCLWRNVRVIAVHCVRRQQEVNHIFMVVADE